MEEALRLLGEHGKGRSVRLPISVPVHTPLMAIAAERLGTDLQSIQVEDLSIPLVNNVAATPIQAELDVRASLLAQLSAPVLWEDSIQRLLSMGVKQFIEIGPGGVLSRLVKSITPEVEVWSIQNPEGAQCVIEAMTNV